MPTSSRFGWVISSGGSPGLVVLMDRIGEVSRMSMQGALADVDSKGGTVEPIPSPGAPVVCVSARMVGTLPPQDSMSHAVSEQDPPQSGSTGGPAPAPWTLSLLNAIGEGVCLVTPGGALVWANDLVRSWGPAFLERISEIGRSALGKKTVASGMAPPVLVQHEGREFECSTSRVLVAGLAKPGAPAPAGSPPRRIDTEGSSNNPAKFAVIAAASTSKATTTPGSCNWNAQPTCSPAARKASSSAPSATQASTTPAV